MKKIILAIFISLITLNLIGQPKKWRNKKYLTIVSYNVENLFDTIDNPHKNDNEFTPEKAKNWNTKKYFAKIDQLAYVISEINKNELPELIGLVEVENKNVLEDLVKNKKLKKANYSILVDNGPDPRGINCACLYNPKTFTYLSHHFIPVSFPFSNNKRTRNILYFKGLTKKDTIHLFVNHWSSRRGGKKKSEPKRIQTAKVLKNKVDSLLTNNPESNIIILGDFNDEPNNTSIKNTLQATPLNEQSILYNMMYENYTQGKGTYYFRGKFNVLDHLIVNRNMLKKRKGLRPYSPNAFIFNPDTICYVNKNKEKSPAKTYGGKNYYGGCSDHFPIYGIFYER